MASLCGARVSPVRLHEERGKPRASGPGADHDTVQVADGAVADIDLPAVENVVVAVPFGGGLHAEDKATGVGFCNRDRRQAVTGRYGRQPSFFWISFPK
jgi:hypothetical protein